MKKRIIIGLVLFLLMCVGGLFWYDATYSMDEVESYEIGNPQAEKSVLIATQGSEYKNALTDSLVNYLSPYNVYISVQDVNLLSNVNVNDWNAIVIMHTWEVWKPQEDAKAFLNDHYDASKMTVLCTSGGGDEMVDGVDAITGASIMKDLPEHFNQIKSKLKGILALE